MRRIEIATVRTIIGNYPEGLLRLVRTFEAGPLRTWERQEVGWDGSDRSVESYLSDYVFTGIPGIPEKLEGHVGFAGVKGGLARPGGIALAREILDARWNASFPRDSEDPTADVYGAIAALGHPRFGYLDAVIVGEEFRRHGIGARLLVHVAMQLYFDGIPHLVVRCPPKDRDWLAPALERRGFALEHRYVRDDESFYGRDVTGWHLSSS